MEKECSSSSMAKNTHLTIILYIYLYSRGSIVEGGLSPPIMQLPSQYATVSAAVGTAQD